MTICDHDWVTLDNGIIVVSVCETCGERRRPTVADRFAAWEQDVVLSDSGVEVTLWRDDDA